MAGVFIAQCEECGFEQRVVGHGDYAYRLPEPPDVFLWAQFAWCNSCQKVVQAEKLLTTAAMEEWSTGSNNRSRRDMERYRQMTASRISSARCLKCGSSDIIAATGDWPNYLVLHSLCGGSIVLHHNGSARLSGTKAYSPEGEYVTTVNGILIPGRGY